MSRAKILRAGLLLAAMLLLAQGPGAAQDRGAPKPVPPFTPRFEALAETKLLMEGLALPNYRGVERLLKGKAPDVESWAFARGQALLMAETGNLLLLRPPRNSGRDTWMRLAMGMRDKAGELARAAAARDLPKTKQALEAVKASCNRCHETFRVPVKVGPEPRAGEHDT